MLPAGFMLAPSAGEATLTVVICSDHGPQTVTVDEDDSGSRPTASHRTCPFAASALPALPGEPPQLFAEVEYASVLYTPAPLAFSLTPRPGAVSARGPPRTV